MSHTATLWILAVLGYGVGGWGYWRVTSSNNPKILDLILLMVGIALMVCSLIYIAQGDQ